MRVRILTHSLISSSLSESNLTSQFGAVFRAKVGRFFRFLAEKQVKMGLFAEKQLSPTSC